MKSWYQSRTVWLNLITLLVAGLAVPDVISLVPPDGMKYLLAASALLNLILRVYFTTTEVQH